MEFTVKLDRFEGPYTKLLELITERKLSITEISLVEVSDEYIAYIQSLPGKDSGDISQFIVVASTLMLMKAKSLLPGLVYTEEEEKQVHDLERKLELHQTLLRATGLIRSIHGKAMLYERERISYKGSAVFVPDERVSPTLLQSVALLTLSTFIIPKQMVNVAIEQSLRIETVIEQLLERVRSASTFTLQSLVDSRKSIEENKKILIVHFIALLELMRHGSIALEQTKNGDIYISKSEAGSMI